MKENTLDATSKRMQVNVERSVVETLAVQIL